MEKESAKEMYNQKKTYMKQDLERIKNWCQEVWHYFLYTSTTQSVRNGQIGKKKFKSTFCSNLENYQVVKNPTSVVTASYNFSFNKTFSINGI